MRIDRLYLLRYGRFTDAAMDLPARGVDLHIILGPNEAGKSTTLSAIESLLFGIARNSPYGFLHNYNALRIGATLRQDGQTLHVWRRKGSRNTLLDRDDSPMAGGEAALAPFLGGADQAFFSRMFCLDHERLRQGGREILDARDEIGQILFSAGSGLTGLRDKLAALHHDADALWAPRRAGHRKYYQALDRLEAADKAMRENRVTASHWATRKKEYDEVQKEYGELESARAALVLEQRKLNRIRRVYRFVHDLVSIGQQISSLGEVTPLAPDALGQLDKAERALHDSEARIDTLRERLDAEQRERMGMQCEEDLLFREQEIQQFHQRRIEVQKEKEDLVHRQAELANAQENLNRLAGELGWDARDHQALIVRIPSRATLQQAGNALRIRGEKSSSVENARAALAEAEDRLAELRGEISGISVVDAAPLAALIQSARQSGDLTARMQAAETEISDAAAAVRHALQSLRPTVPEAGSLASTAFPPPESVLRHRDSLRDGASKLADCREQMLGAAREAEELQHAIERLTKAEDAVSRDEIAEARSSRDTKWLRIRRRFIERTEAKVESPGGQSEEDLPTAYEDAVGRADTLADMRSRNAEATAELELASRKLAEQQQRIGSLRARELELGDEMRAREEAWRQLWSATPVEPLAPELMLEWLSARDTVLQASERSTRAERQLSLLRLEEQEWKTAILRELAAVNTGADGWQVQPLRVVIERAAVLQTQYEQEANRRKRLEEEIRKSTADVERKRRALGAGRRRSGVGKLAGGMGGVNPRAGIAGAGWGGGGACRPPGGCSRTDAGGRGGDPPVAAGTHRQNRTGYRYLHPRRAGLPLVVRGRCAGSRSL